MADVTQGGRFPDHGVVSSTDTLPGATPPSAMLPDVAATAGTLADVVTPAITVLGDDTKMPSASDTSPPHESRQSSPGGAGGLTPAERLASLPPPDESQPYEPVEVPAADVFDYLVGGDQHRRDH